MEESLLYLQEFEDAKKARKGLLQPLPYAGYNFKISVVPDGYFLSNQETGNRSSKVRIFIRTLCYPRKSGTSSELFVTLKSVIKQKK